MSFDAYLWALKVRNIRPSHKLILLALADRAGADDTAWPSKAQIEFDTELDRKTIMKAIHQLCQLGLIKDTGKRMGSTKQVPVYKLIGVIHREDNNKGAQNRDYYQNKGARFSHERGPKTDDKGAQKRDTEPVREPIKEPTGNSEEKEKALALMKQIIGKSEAFNG